MPTRTSPRLATFEKFWPYYVGEHSKALTRWLHLAGTLGGPIALVAMIATGYGRYFLLALIYADGLAWSGHCFVDAPIFGGRQECLPHS